MTGLCDRFLSFLDLRLDLLSGQVDLLPFFSRFIKSRRAWARRICPVRGCSSALSRSYIPGILPGFRPDRSSCRHCASIVMDQFVRKMHHMTAP